MGNKRYLQKLRRVYSKKMKVLLTRALHDSEELAKELLKHHIESHIDPLFKIQLNAFKEDFSETQALVITSPNGIKSFASQSQERSLPLFVVGEESKRLASSLHFKNVIQGEGTAFSLLPLIQMVCPSLDKEIAYITGNYIHTDLCEHLRHKGYMTKRIIAYNTIEKTSFEPKTFQFLKEKTISVVVLFSPRSAQIFAKLIQNNKDVCQSLYGACLSMEVMNNVSEMPWKQLYTAASPTRQEIIRILKYLKEGGVL
ncbi:MAG: hypothetical protein BGO77_04690 [Caedibacter sp. 37-49]|nr:MAG: hypothetical protein BGO77_04690 [Caedibacter sp. 37-49]